MSTATFNSEFMRQAIDWAAKNLLGDEGGPFGAVVVKDGEVVAGSANQVVRRNDPSAHAEVMAIRLACEKLASFQLTGCELYASCEPCPMCLGAIYWARPQAFFFACSREDAKATGFDDSFIYDEIALASSRRTIIGLHQPDARAVEIMRTWSARPNRRLY